MDKRGDQELAGRNMISLALVTIFILVLIFGVVPTAMPFFLKKDMYAEDKVNRLIEEAGSLKPGSKTTIPLPLKKDAKGDYILKLIIACDKDGKIDSDTCNTKGSAICLVNMAEKSKPKTCKQVQGGAIETPKEIWNIQDTITIAKDTKGVITFSLPSESSGTTPETQTSPIGTSENTHAGSTTPTNSYYSSQSWEKPDVLNEEINPIQEKIMQYAKKWGIEEALALAVAKKENANFDPNDVSSEGCVSVMQVCAWQDCTFEFPELTGVDDLKGEDNLDKNLECGMIILKKKYDEYKDGCQPTWAYDNSPQIKDACDNCKSDYASDAPYYRDYRGWDAALRAYNGIKCDGDEMAADEGYVEKVNILLEDYGVKLNTLT